MANDCASFENWIDRSVELLCFQHIGRTAKLTVLLTGMGAKNAWRASDEVHFGCRRSMFAFPPALPERLRPEHTDRVMFWCRTSVIASTCGSMSLRVRSDAVSSLLCQQAQ